MKFPSIRRAKLSTLQVNLGYKCNQVCVHCHVDASPKRKEMMDAYNISLIPKVIDIYKIKTLDITGGAPEMHPLFTDLITSVAKFNIKIIDRCNLTILQEPGYENMAKFLADKGVSIVASLPCYEEENVDAQRGKNVFNKSIDVLQKLNKLGYGNSSGKLKLDLVYNPSGASLAPSQDILEKKFKEELMKRYQIKFDNLLVLTNMPIKRFSDNLKREGKLNDYLTLLKENHNENNLNSLMCKETISVDWQGNLFDCDFNQQIRLNKYLTPSKLEDLAKEEFLLEEQQITVGEHCFGCTAGNGSSCGGALT